MMARGNVRRQLCNNVTVAMGVDGAMSSDGQAAVFPDRAGGQKTDISHRYKTWCFGNGYIF